VADRLAKIDIENARHLRQADNHGVRLRDGAAGQGRACPARHDGNAVTAAIFQNGGHLRRGFRQGDSQGHLAVGDEGIGLERDQAALLTDQAAVRKDIGEILDDLMAAREHGWFRLQKGNRLRHISLPAHLHSAMIWPTPHDWYFFFTTFNMAQQMLISFSVFETMVKIDDESGRS
jgi:hypothetical protein